MANKNESRGWHSRRSQGRGKGRESGPRHENKEGLGTMYQEYDDGTFRLTSEGVEDVLFARERYNMYGDMGREEQEISDLLPEWVHQVSGLSKELESSLTDEWMDPAEVIDDLKRNEFITERVRYECINKQNEEVYGRGNTLYDNDEIDEMSKDDPKPINDNTPQQGQRQQLKLRGRPPRRGGRGRGEDINQSREERGGSEQEQEEGWWENLLNERSDRFAAKGLRKLLDSLEQQARSKGGENLTMPDWVPRLEPTVQFMNRLEDVLQRGWRGKEDFLRRMGEVGTVKGGVEGDDYKEVLREIREERGTEPRLWREEQAGRPQDRPPLNTDGLMKKEIEHISKREGYNDDDYEAPEKAERNPGTLYERNEDGKTRLTSEGLGDIASKVYEASLLAEQDETYRENLKVSDLAMEWTMQVANLYRTLFDIVQQIKKGEQVDGYGVMTELHKQDFVSQETVGEWGA